jgi:hypothetical protein
MSFLRAGTSALVLKARRRANQANPETGHSHAAQSHDDEARHHQIRQTKLTILYIVMISATVVAVLTYFGAR